jgi:hypothetical protein
MKLIIYFSGTGEDEITSTKSSIKEWTTASKDKCLNCDKRVSMNHRHHCRICGQGHFCDNCSPKREGVRFLRICSACFNQMDGNDLLGRSYCDPQCLAHDVSMLVINGCHKTDTAGFMGAIFPDLNIISRKLISLFSNNMFKNNKTVIKQQLRNAYGGFFTSCADEFINLDCIVLSGFSRGAVSCFNFIKYLYMYKYTKNIPVHIFANQPVPGNAFNTRFSIAREHINLSTFSNLKSCLLILGTYDKNKIGFLQKNFFKQLIPDFSKQTNLDVRLLPITDHLGGFALTQIYANYFFNEFLPGNYGINLTTKNTNLSENLEYRYDHYYHNYALERNRQSFFRGGENYKFKQDKAPIIDAYSYYMPKVKKNSKEWTTASKDKCLNCDKRVSMNHRHHCRICGQGHFCDNCSPKRSFFDNLRVCDPCVDKYQNYEAP